VAEANLGLMYWKGLGVTKDNTQAVYWFRQAAEQDFAWAEYYLGTAYAQGLGVKRNDAQAMAWLRKAAEQDYTEAQYALGVIYARRGSARLGKADAAYWFARAAQSGHEVAENSLPSQLTNLPRVRIRVATDIREAPKATATIIRTAAIGEYAFELDRQNDWAQVYLRDQHTVGFVQIAQLRRK